MGVHKQLFLRNGLTQLNLSDVTVHVLSGLQLILWKRHAYHQSRNLKRLKNTSSPYFDNTMGTDFGSCSSCCKKQERVLGHHIISQSVYIQHHPTIRKEAYWTNHEQGRSTKSVGSTPLILHTTLPIFEGDSSASRMQLHILHFYMLLQQSF